MCFKLDNWLKLKYLLINREFKFKERGVCFQLNNAFVYLPTLRRTNTLKGHLKFNCGNGNLGNLGSKPPSVNWGFKIVATDPFKLSLVLTLKRRTFRKKTPITANHLVW